jgi:vacuolar-type H+-ATPase catalytic subunit A/Vma1
LPSLRRLLRTLASVGVFTEPEPGVFALTPLGQTLTSSQPGSMRDVAIMFMETHYAPFADLLATIRTGQPAAERFYGQPFFAWLSQDSWRIRWRAHSRRSGRLAEGRACGPVPRGSE